MSRWFSELQPKVRRAEQHCHLEPVGSYRPICQTRPTTTSSNYPRKTDTHSLPKVERQVNLSLAAVKRRTHRLEKELVSGGYRVRVDDSQLGRPSQPFMEFCLVECTALDHIDSIGDRMPQVQSIFTIAGGPGVLVPLGPRDVDDLKRVVDTAPRHQSSLNRDAHGSRVLAAQRRVLIRLTAC